MFYIMRELAACDESGCDGTVKKIVWVTGEDELMRQSLLIL